MVPGLYDKYWHGNVLNEHQQRWGASLGLESNSLRLTARKQGRESEWQSFYYCSNDSNYSGQHPLGNIQSVLGSAAS